MKIMQPQDFSGSSRSNTGRFIILIALIGTLIGVGFLFVLYKTVDISRPPFDVACTSSEHPTYNYDEIYRNVFLSDPDYGFTHTGGNYSAYYNFYVGIDNHAEFDKIGPFSLDMVYWVEGEEDEVFHFNISIYQVSSVWSGLDVDHDHAPARLGKIGEMELTGLGQRIEDSVFVNLDIDLTDLEYMAIEITSDIENATVGFGFSDPDYYYDYFDEPYYIYDYYDDYIGVYYDEPHLFSENTDLQTNSLWYLITLIGVCVFASIAIVSAVIEVSKQY